MVGGQARGRNKREKKWAKKRMIRVGKQNHPRWRLSPPHLWLHRLLLGANFALSFSLFHAKHRSTCHQPDLAMVIVASVSSLMMHSALLNPLMYKDMDMVMAGVQVCRVVAPHVQESALVGGWLTKACRSCLAAPAACCAFDGAR